MVNESSLLSTGYSTYGYEVLTRLYKTGKYEIAELAAYGSASDPRVANIPWKYYPNIPENPKLKNEYNSKPSYQFGEFRFEEVCLDFKPDIVWDIRDWWMMEFEERSPARPYYHWVIMPTVDSAPQNDSWISTFAAADGVFAYSDWGLEELRKQTNNRIKLQCSAPPGADLKNYLYCDKTKSKLNTGLTDDVFIVGTVMRNQIRKLYPDLMQAFREFLDTAPEDIAKKTYLYLHCAYPDVGWDIPRLIKEHGIGHKTYFTYYCIDCQEIYPSFFQDGKAPCKFCGGKNAVMPNIKHGVPPKVLNEIMGLFDVYVQYAICEGFGMPQVEAAASGTPVMAVDYSAMSDVVRKLKGFPISVQRMFRDASTESYRALPDNKDFINKLTNILSKSKEERTVLGKAARQAVEDNYTWEKTAKIWEDYFDSVIPLDKWDEPAKIHVPDLNVPSEMTDSEFVSWAFTNIAGRPELLNSYLSVRLTRDLGLGMCVEGLSNMLVDQEHSSEAYARFGDFTKEALANHLLHICKQKNLFEQKRGKTNE